MWLVPSCESSPCLLPSSAGLVLICRLMPLSSSGAFHCCFPCPIAWLFQGCNHWLSVNLVLRNFTFVGRKEHFYSFLSLNRDESQGTCYWQFHIPRAWDWIGTLVSGFNIWPRTQLVLFKTRGQVLEDDTLTSEEPCYLYLQGLPQLKGKEHMKKANAPGYKISDILE